jgi:hypothetical protein
VTEEGLFPKLTLPWMSKNFDSISAANGTPQSRGRMRVCRMWLVPNPSPLSAVITAFNVCSNIQQDCKRCSHLLSTYPWRWLLYFQNIWRFEGTSVDVILCTSVRKKASSPALIYREWNVRLPPVLSLVNTESDKFVLTSVFTHVICAHAYFAHPNF